MNPEQLRDLGFQLEGRAPGGESGGAWFAIAADGARVVLKWFADEGVADRYAVLLPAIDVLRSRGVPVPEYPFVRAVDGWTLSAQQALPGRSFPIAPPRLVDRMIECVGAAAGIVGGPQPVPALQGWGEFVIHTLTVGEDWAQHDSLRAHSDRARRILDFVESVGADAEPSWFPTSGLVHFDLHTDNVLALDDGTLTGITTLSTRPSPFGFLGGIARRGSRTVAGGARWLRRLPFLAQERPAHRARHACSQTLASGAVSCHA